MEIITMAKLSYKEAYMRLEELADEVHALNLSDLDKLISITEKATKYVKVCEERIEAVKEKLNAFSNEKDNEKYI